MTYPDENDRLPDTPDQPSGTPDQPAGKPAIPGTAPVSVLGGDRNTSGEVNLTNKPERSDQQE